MVFGLAGVSLRFSRLTLVDVRTFLDTMGVPFSLGLDFPPGFVGVFILRAELSLAALASISKALTKAFALPGGLGSILTLSGCSGSNLALASLTEEQAEDWKVL